MRYFFLIIVVSIVPVNLMAGPGRVDLSLGINFLDGAKINAIVVQSDGKAIVAGSFRIANETRRDIIRLNADNTIDGTFNAGTALSAGSGWILAVKLQPDGKILVGGNFNNFSGDFVERLIRLNPDGSVDQGFSLTGINVTAVFDIDLQSNGKILASSINNAGTSFVARFGTTGMFDPTFEFPFFGGSGFRIDVRDDDKVILGGVFTYTVNQDQFRNLARLNVDGKLDGTFRADVASATFPSVDVMEASGGRVLIWGEFDLVNGLTRRGIAIVTGDGTTDTQFDPSAIQNETIFAAEFQSDGKVIIAGENFTRANTLVRGNIARLNPDGSVDDTFFQGRGANGAIRAIRLRGPDRLVIGGDFFRVDRAPRKFLAQIHV